MTFLTFRKFPASLAWGDGAQRFGPILRLLKQSGWHWCGVVPQKFFGEISRGFSRFQRACNEGVFCHLRSLACGRPHEKPPQSPSIGKDVEKSKSPFLIKLSFHHSLYQIELSFQKPTLLFLIAVSCPNRISLPKTPFSTIEHALFLIQIFFPNQNRLKGDGFWNWSSTPCFQCWASLIVSARKKFLIEFACVGPGTKKKKL